MSSNQLVALSLLSSLYEQIKGIENEQFKIRTQTQIADVLWQYDEPRAREIFTKSFNAIDSIKSLPKNISVSPGAKPDINRFKDGLRFEMIQIISRHDVKLAETLMKSTKDTESENALNKADNANPNADSMQELKFAMALAKSNPEKSAQIIRNRLRSGYDESFIPILLEIRRKNEALSNQLFTDFLAAASAQQPSVMKVASLAMYVTPNESDAFLGQNQPVSQTLIKQYLSFAYPALSQWINTQRQAAIDDQIDQQTVSRDLTILKQIVMPLLERASPSQSANLRSQLTLLFEKQNIGQANFSNSENQDEVQELIDKADATVGTKQRDSLYMRAAMLAKQKGDVEKALAIAERISGEQDKFTVSSIITYQAGFDALRKKDVDTALHYAKKTLFIPQRTYLYNEIARSLLNNKDRLRAGEILNELKNWLDKTDNSGHKAEGLLFIATTTADYDSAQGFEMLRSAVDVINKVNFELDGNSKNDGHLKTIPMTLERLDFKSVFSLLARADFSQALSLAQSLNKKEAAVTAQLAVCQEVLNANSTLPKSQNTKKTSKN
ncbi:MAG TPA: hypothetical protein VEQ18_03205 [Candidatus Nitrosocosmicus sp.]|nr:hypothetical protein [Candidatus Nitrosocosmicus sp.]